MERNTLSGHFDSEGRCSLQELAAGAVGDEMSLSLGSCQVLLASEQQSSNDTFSPQEMLLNSVERSGLYSS